MKEKETATFICETSMENMESVWMKDGKQIKADKRIEIIREKKIHKLVIREVTTTDKGQYSCVIGSMSTSAKLIVEGKCTTGTKITMKLHLLFYFIDVVLVINCTFFT